MTAPLFRPQFPPAIQRVIDRLYAETIEQDPHTRNAALAEGKANESHAGFYEAMTDARMPVTPEFGMTSLGVLVTAANKIIAPNISVPPIEQ